MFKLLFMENEITNTGMDMETELSITLDGRNYLGIASKWATFLAIMGFIGTGFLALLGVCMMLISPFLGSFPKIGSTIGIPFVLLGVFYLLFAVLYFFPAYYLYNFATKIKTALYSNNQTTLDESLKNLKKTFQFMGIMTIALIGLYFVIILTFIISAISKGMAV